MRVLYCAIDQRVPGTVGGSTHVQAVSEGLASLGHEVHTLVGSGDGPFPAGAVRWHALGAPGGRPQLRLLRARAVERVARAVSPDVVIERYHNFGGEGTLAASRTGARMVLEVNAPIVDVPGSSKSRLDRLMIVRPFERWRDWQVRHADLLVTPSARIVPASVSRDRILELEWGADTNRFHPGTAGPVPWTREPATVVAVFAGAFRVWHGAIQLVESIKRLHAAGRRDIRAVLIGDGPERAAAERTAGSHPGIVFTGALPYASMPAALAAADIGVAPFDAARHPPLTLDFYWSPLKIFEYMASGLPVVAPALERLTRLVADGTEGVLYSPASANALDDALVRAADPVRRAAMGTAARNRAVRDFSWQAHCAALDTALRAIV